MLFLDAFKYILFKNKPLSEQRNQINILKLYGKTIMYVPPTNPNIELVFKVLFKFKSRKNNLWANIIFSD
jgi:hypothetical protein